MPGPYTFETRAEILDRLLVLQHEVGRTLISAEEIARIKTIWAEDAVQNAAYAAAVAG